MAETIHGKRWLALSAGMPLLSISFNIANQKWGTNFPEWLLYSMVVFAVACLVYWVVTTDLVWARVAQGLWDKRILDPIPDKVEPRPSRLTPENPERRQYVIETLTAFIDEGHKNATKGYQPLSATIGVDPRSRFDARVERFLQRYLDDECLWRFREKEVEALEEIFSEALMPQSEINRTPSVESARLTVGPAKSQLPNIINVSGLSAVTAELEEETTFRLSNGASKESFTAFIATFQNDADPPNLVGEPDDIEADIRFYTLDHENKKKYDWAHIPNGCWIGYKEPFVSFPLQSNDGPKQRSLVLAVRRHIESNDERNWPLFEYWEYDHATKKPRIKQSGFLQYEDVVHQYHVVVKLSNATFAREFAFDLKIGQASSEFLFLGDIKRK